MRKKIRVADYNFLFLYMVACILILWRAFYGLDWSDESYYIAVTERFFQGDHPFREEWFPTQLIGILLLPVYSLYRFIFGGNDGILLFMRLCYLGFSIFVSLLMYFCLVRNDNIQRIPAAMAVFSNLFYVRANIPTMSYYSLGLGCFLIFLLLRKVEDGRTKILSGVAFSVSVVCMPYLTLYFILILLWEIYRYSKNRNFILLKENLWILFGIFLSALVFFAYFFAAGNVSDVWLNINEILKDPEHQSTLIESLVSFLRFMEEVFYRYLFFPEIVLTVCIIIYHKMGEASTKVKKVLKAGAYILYGIHVIYLRTFFEGGIIIAFSVLALQISMLDGNKALKSWRKYALPGFAFGIIWVLGSNVGQRVFNMGCLVACIWAYEVIWNDVKSTIFWWIRICKCLSMFCVIGVMLMIRLFDIYRDEPVWNLTTRIENGAGKGLYTTNERAAEYENVLECLNKYAGEGKTLVVGGTNPWVYVEAEAECGAFAAWHVDFDDARNEIYYERYTEKKPDVIFLLEPEYGKYEAWRYSSHGGNDTGYGTETLNGYFKELVSENYQCFEEPCGKFYVRNL